MWSASPRLMTAKKAKRPTFDPLNYGCLQIAASIGEDILNTVLLSFEMHPQTQKDSFLENK